MAKIKINDKVFIKDGIRQSMGYMDNIEFTVKDIIEKDLPAPVVLSAKEFGEHWVCFVTLDEVELSK